MEIENYLKDNVIFGSLVIIILMTGKKKSAIL